MLDSIILHCDVMSDFLCCFPNLLQLLHFASPMFQEI